MWCRGRNLAGDRVILGEGDFDPFVAFVLRDLFAAARGGRIGQCGSAAQAALARRGKDCVTVIA